MTAFDDVKKAVDFYAEYFEREVLGDLARNAIPALESLQRENEKLRQSLFPYADRTDISGISWGGKYLIGDKASITAFYEMKNRGEQIDVYKRAYDQNEAALKARAEAAEAEVKRLQAEIDRKSSMPGDHRYWEGRYRDEAAENEKLREALTPFVLAFESRRETYSKRYRSNRQLGYANFDKMPDDWAMEKVAFNMGTYRCARKALSSAGRDPLREFDALVEGPSFTEIASTGGEHHAE